MRRKKRHLGPPRRTPTLSITQKSSRILRLVLAVMLILIARMWYLSVAKHEDFTQKAQGPQRREVLVKAERATIRDRFNTPLAINKTQYNAAILYAHIRQLPRIEWITNEQGKKVKRYHRKEHIKKLSQLLANELHLDPRDIEDQIHARAALFPQVPLVIKADLSEAEYYRLRMLEKEWPGLIAERSSKRYYPLGLTASHLIGYMGAISGHEYDLYAQELRHLRHLWKEWKEGADVELPWGLHSWKQLKQKLDALEEKAYTIDDRVGKTGIEAAFEEELRGYHGRKAYYSDARGNFLRELPGSRPTINGQRVLLSISAELQDYVEKLLIQSERLRDGKSRERNRQTGAYATLRQPWIKGAAAVVMDPNNGEVLALASYPRFDPNDFISHGDPYIQQEKAERVHGWFENEVSIAGIWEGRVPLKRELFSPPQKVNTEEIIVNWEQYLQFILPKNHPVKTALEQVYTVETAISLLKEVEKERISGGAESVLDLVNALYAAQEQMYGNRLTPTKRQDILQRVSRSHLAERYLKPLESNYDKLLLLDLCRLLIDEQRFSGSLLKQLGQRPLLEYHSDTLAFIAVERELKSMLAQLFHEEDFFKWREQHGARYLKVMRAHEQAAGKYAQPYLRYYNSMENSLFKIFWERHRWGCLAALLRGDSSYLMAYGPELTPYAEFLLTWHNELSQGAHSALSWVPHYHRLKNLLGPLSPNSAKQYLQTMRHYEDLSRPLLGKYRNLRNGVYEAQEKHLAAAFYPTYGFGFARSHGFRQATSQGSLFKLVTAYAALMQLHEEKRIAGRSTTYLNPLIMTDKPYRISGSQRWMVGFHEDGSPIPQIYKGGRLIRSVSSQIGRIDLQGAVERSSNPYFSLLAGDVLHDPEQLNKAAKAMGYGARTGIELPGEFGGRLPDDLSYNPSGLYAYAIGQHTLVANPLQTAVMLSALANGGTIFEPKIVSLTVGKEPLRNDLAVLENSPTIYQKYLAHMGIDFPLFTKAETSVQRQAVTPQPPRIRRHIPMPKDVRTALLRSMAGVTKRLQTVGRPALSHHYKDWPAPIQALMEMGDSLVGKTSTAESLEGIDLDLHNGVQMYNHTWFGGIAFEESKNSTPLVHRNYNKPEVVVVVYLRFGSYGTLAAPIAAQIVKKWREIQAAHASDDTSIGA